MEEKRMLSYKKIISVWMDRANEWLEKWSAEFDKHAAPKKIFTLSDSDFPEEEIVKKIILDAINVQGDFDITYDYDDCFYRVTYIVGYKEIAAAWLEKWEAKFAEQEKLQEGFAIPASEFPEEEYIVDMILYKISIQGDFSTMYDEEADCYRFAYVSI